MTPTKWLLLGSFLGLALLYVTFSGIREEFGPFYGVSTGTMGWLWLVWLVVMAFILWPHRHFRHTAYIDKLGREQEIINTHAAFETNRIKAELLPVHTRLALDLQEVLYRQAINDGLPVEFVTAYRNQKIVSMLEPMLKRELSRIGVEEKRDMTEIELDAKEKEARTKIDMLEVAAKVKRELDGYIRKDNPGGKS